MESDTPGVWLQRILRAEMAERGWVQRHVAEATGATQQSVSNWLQGKLPEPPQAVRLAVALDADPIWFLGHLWPEIAAADPIPVELRDLIGQATTEQRHDITLYAHTLIHPTGVDLAYAADVAGIYLRSIS